LDADDRSTRARFLTASFTSFTALLLLLLLLTPTEALLSSKFVTEDDLQSSFITETVQFLNKTVQT
jgi:hypothetical protein